ncbi:hydroxymethylpyrimidine/phosphomethylpyrimidine kinase [Arthrobacter sp. B3I9]|nr:hydroxymethylpyrimidine/phosphomethylpyrimidine kinase [Arthrobacter sp. B3I9]
MSIVATAVFPSAFLPSRNAAVPNPAVPNPAGPAIPRVLAIAGSDPSGGAGIQADLKSIAAHGGYGMAAITALTAQNTRGVTAVHIPPADFLAAQLDAVSADISIDAVKIGMLGDAAVIDAVRRWLEQARPGVVVLDPVMVATSGDRLLAEAAETALHTLLPLADLITPNLAELALLLREPVAADWSEALDQGKRLAALSGTTVLVKGGHLDSAGGNNPDDGEPGHDDGGCPDALVNTGGLLGRETVVVPGRRVPTSNSHGTGCSLSSALATVQARVGDWEAALREVKPWLEGALRSSNRLDVGTGNGPVHHFHHVQHLTASHGQDGTQMAEGEFVSALWAGAAEYLEEIYGLGFIQGLADGTLPEKDFAYYLAQDALYLNGYSRVLARAAALAPSEAEQLLLGTLRTAVPGG